MYICLCNAITDKQIRRAAKSGVRNLWGLQRELGVATNCGRCKDHATSILHEAKNSAKPGRFAEPAVIKPSTA
ncbi:MAG: bacterioferritin-associated ferredoxin [Gammaproteobacteria bacterium]|nr:bacterioferritin-associated ferredoxin [Gammaproteobacteria bacterium]